MKRNPKHILQQKQGVALMTVLLFFMVMVIMIGSLSILTHGNFRNSTVPKESVAAYYAAEAGINIVIDDFKGVVDENLDTTISTFSTALNQFINDNANEMITLAHNGGASSYAVVSVEKVSEEDGIIDIKISSKGNVGSLSRTVETRITLEYGSGVGQNPGFTVKHALLTKGEIDFGNNTRIGITYENAGPLGRRPVPNDQVIIASMSTRNNDIILGNRYTGIVETINGSSRVISGNYTSSKIKNFDSEILERDPVFPVIDFKEVRDKIEGMISNDAMITNLKNHIESGSGTFTINKSGVYYIDRLQFSGNNLNIHSDHDITIITDKLDFQKDVTFTGTKKVSLYLRRNMVNDVLQTSDISDLPFKISASASGTIGRLDNQPHLFLVYVDDIRINSNNPLDSYPLLVNGSITLNGSFMLANANVTVGGGGAFKGYFVNGGSGVTLDNNSNVSTTLYYVPNGKVSVSNNGVIQGAVIADSFESDNSNNTGIVYDTTFAEHFPFDILSPIVGEDSGEETVQSPMLTIHQTIEQ